MFTDKKDKLAKALRRALSVVCNSKCVVEHDDEEMAYIRQISDIISALRNHVK